MKRAITIVLLVVLFPSIMLLVGMCLPRYYENSYYAELPEMYENLTSSTGKKIVIIGGSNVAFGVNSAELESILKDYGYDYDVCNFGLYAAVGTSAMLELSKNAIEEGDIVVLAIEPTSETFSTYFGATAFWKCMESHPYLLLELNGSQKEALVGNYITYLQDRMSIYYSGILPNTEGVYAKASFDDRGDMIYERAGNLMMAGYDTGNPIDLSNVVFQQEFVQQVKEYCEYVEGKGAQVVMSFSPMNRGALVETHEDVIYEFFLKLQENFPCEIISNPNDYIMDSGWFYDSNFHLNTAGAKVRTFQLAEDFLNYWDCSLAFDYELPQMPNAIVQNISNSEEVDFFLFEEIDGTGYQILGLTQLGKSQTQLTIPTYYNEKPVVTISIDAFRENQILEEIILPESIESLPEGVFSGCTSLTRLVLLHRERLMTVTEKTFSGADNMKIYVPQEVYSLYRDGAGCATNQWEIYLNRMETY